jgi:hypothetical protein
VGSGEILKAGVKVIPFLHLTKKVPDDLNTYSEKHNPQKQVPNLQVSESKDFDPDFGVMKELLNYLKELDKSYIEAFSDHIELLINLTC